MLVEVQVAQGEQAFRWSGKGFQLVVAAVVQQLLPVFWSFPSLSRVAVAVLAVFQPLSF